METTCKYCGKPLTERQIKVGNKYCSKSCAVQHRADLVPVPEVRCEWCGKQLTKEQIHRGCKRYCSTRCTAEARKSIRHTCTCIVCGREFEAPTTRAKICSAECKYKRQQELDAQKPAKPKPKTKRGKKKSQIDKIQAEAQANGMSYGRWKALQYMQSIPKIETRI